MRNIKLIIQYDGRRYRGWQRLKDSKMTIQGKIEDVLSRMTEETIELIGSGRTDAGVHALYQVANFKTNSKLSTREMLDYCYRFLPEDIVIKEAYEVHDKFHARHNVRGKKYLYKIINSRYHDPLLKGFVTHIPHKLNIKSMKEASAYLIGELDFSSFTSLKSKKKSKVREIYSIDIVKDKDIINIMFHGNGFLYNMIRIIVGTLIEVGLGNIKPEEVKEILLKRDRKYAGPTAPAEGLFLYDVEY